MDLFTVLRNIYLKIQKNINVERITNSEIDDAFGEAAGTGTDAQDYVVEHKTGIVLSDNSNWEYRKWASGKIDCWGYKSENIASYGTAPPYGNAFVMDVNFPITFISTPALIPAVQLATQFTVATLVSGNITTTNTKVYGACPLSGTQQMQVWLYVWGHYK